MRETGLERVGGRFLGPIWRNSDQIGKDCHKVDQKMGLGNMKCGLFWIATALVGLETGPNKSRNLADHLQNILDKCLIHFGSVLAK